MAARSAASSAVGWNPGPAAVARSTKSWPASDAEDGVEAGRSVGGRQGQHGNGEHVLGADPQGLPARHEHLDPGAPLEQIDEGRAHRRDLFEVVEHEQHLTLGQLLHQALERRAGGGARARHGADDRGQHGIGVPLGRQVDEGHAVPEPLGGGSGGLDGKAGLAGAAGAQQGDEAGGGVVEQRTELGQLRPRPTNDEVGAGRFDRGRGAPDAAGPGWNRSVRRRARSSSSSSRSSSGVENGLYDGPPSPSSPRSSWARRGSRSGAGRLT